MTKDLIRKNFIQSRLLITKEEINKLSLNICNKIININLYQEADSILVYKAARNEVDLSFLIENARNSGKKVFFPKCMPDHKMVFYRSKSDDDLKIGKFNILEPTLHETPDEKDRIFMVMPGVAFDENGTRIGYGGGYYDRFLKLCRDIPRVAAAFELQILKSQTKIDSNAINDSGIDTTYNCPDMFLPEPTDVPVPVIITEKRIIKCF